MKIRLNSFLYVFIIFILAPFAAAGDVTLAWDPNTEPELLGYRLSYGTASGSYDTHVDVGNVTTHTVSGLLAGTYYFAVKAYSADMESAYSNEVSATVSGGGDTQPPSISSIASSGVTSSGATITWATDEASDTQVEYGATISYGSSTTLNSSMVTSHSQSLSGLTASTTYHYRVKSRDAAGNLATSGDYTFTTATPPDTTPPTISNVSSSNITTTGATIAWTTNEASNTQVDYGTSTSYGSSTTLNSSMVTSHSQSLSGLTASTTYHYRVKSRDAAGNLATSGDYTFTTATPPDTTPPTISNVSSSSITTTGATITWTTNEASNTQIDYGTSTSYGSSTTLNSSMVTSHSQSLSGLTASTTYHYRVKSRDAAGNLATSGDYTFTTATPPDTTPPTISNVSSSGITSNSATITWTTNEAADSQIEYGPQASYGFSTTLNTSMLTSHSQGLSGLSANTTYHYRVKSKDAAGNLATSVDYTLRTTALPDTTAPTITEISSSAVTSSSATITWTTNEVSDSQVEYGTSTSYGSSTTLDSTLLTSHSQALSGLTPSTVYHYRVKSRDSAGNQATSTDNTFTTSAPPDTTPPTISNVAGSGITTTGATITWTTNEASNTQVEYGTSTGYGSSTTLNSSMVTSHSQSLSGLTAGTTYHYRVKSADAAGNLAVSTDYTFRTSDPVDPDALSITNVAGSNITSTGALITWNTNIAADSNVDYGTTTSYGSSATSTTTTTKTDRFVKTTKTGTRPSTRRTTTTSELVTSHSVALSGLTAGTTYHFRVRSTDASGNLVVSADYTFVTAEAADIALGLVAAYAFDEGTGYVSEDLSGNGNTASLNSAGWTSGKYGNAVSLNGINGYLSAGTAGLPAVNEPKTVSFWINVTKKSTSPKTILALANPALEASLKHSYKSLQTGVMDSDNKWSVVGKLPSLNKWHHFAYVFDGSENQLYIDGEPAGRSTIALPEAPVTSFEIGRWIDGSEYFEGSIDDVRIYSRALTQDELSHVMNTPAAESGVPADGEVIPDAGESAPSEEPAVQPAEMPVVDLKLERRTYRQGDTVQTGEFWISNPSMHSRDVELKMWIELPGLQPISLGSLSIEEKLTLEAGFNHNYGAMTLLEIAENAPAGICRIGARLMDPVTGDVLSEDTQAFTIAAAKGTRSRSRLVESPQITMTSYAEGSRMHYVITNKGNASVEIELKLWLENSDGAVTPDFSIGSEGSLKLEPGDSITLTSPTGARVLRARLLNATTGALLATNSTN
ncbi:MAG: fibronectin type III domain-containing protein [Acidobacteria bacterium]|nr:fibronectin type III domain-containing protein [Acidobacteriota bacterium]